MAPSPTSLRAALRREIGSIFPTDSDFEAFCGDYFPEVAARFANGQDRIAKVSLLLAVADEQAIRTALLQYSSKIDLSVRLHERTVKHGIPSRATLLAKSHNLLSVNEEFFEHTVDVSLGIQQVPQLVRAQPLLHAGARGTEESHPLKVGLLDFVLRVERVLLLGMPGAGKTQTLRTLCSQLLSLAKSDPTLPVPFIINFSTFSHYRGTVRGWLAEGLKESAAIPITIGKTLLQQGQLFLLIDGLDEMIAEQRAVALTELNDLLNSADPALARCVVSSRTMEYTDSGVPLMLPAALELQPLSPSQVLEAVAQAGSQATPLGTAIAHDPTIVTLLQTPLMLTVAVRAFAGTPDLALEGRPPTELQQLLYDAYVVQMLRRTAPSKTQRAALTLRWLRWLALYLFRVQSSLFLIERLQPTNLVKERTYKIVFRIAHMLVWGLALGLPLGLIWGLVFWIEGGPLFGLMFGLSAVLIAMLAVMLVGFLYGTVSGLLARKIEPVEHLRWSWAQTSRHWKSHVGRGLGCVLVAFIPLIVAGYTMNKPLGSEPVLRLVGPLLKWPAVWFIAVLGRFIEKGWTKGMHAQSSQPNDGIHSSVRNGIKEGAGSGLFVGLVTGLAFGLSSMLVDEWTSESITKSSGAVMFGGFVGAITGLSVSLGGGMGEALKHYALRMCLWREGSLPLRIVPWLDACRANLLLRRQGGAYLFWHMTLQDYFGALDDKRLIALVQKIETHSIYEQRY